MIGHHQPAWRRLNRSQSRGVSSGGVAVVDIWIAPRRDTGRLRDLLKPWWDRVVEVRCQVPPVVAGER